MNKIETILTDSIKELIKHSSTTDKIFVLEIAFYSIQISRIRWNIAINEHSIW